MVPTQQGRHVCGTCVSYGLKSCAFTSVTYTEGTQSCMCTHVDDTPPVLYT